MVPLNSIGEILMMFTGKSQVKYIQGGEYQ